MADVKKVIEIIDKIIADVDEQKLFLTELDNVIGDGDHGINLARGFDAVKTIEDTFESKDIGAIFKSNRNETCFYSWRSFRSIIRNCIYEVWCIT